MEELLSYANGIAKEKRGRPLSGSAMPMPKVKTRMNDLNAAAVLLMKGQEIAGTKKPPEGRFFSCDPG